MQPEPLWSAEARREAGPPGTAPTRSRSSYLHEKGETTHEQIAAVLLK